MISNRLGHRSGGSLNQQATLLSQHLCHDHKSIDRVRGQEERLHHSDVYSSFFPRLINSDPPLVVIRFTAKLHTKLHNIALHHYEHI